MRLYVGLALWLAAGAPWAAAGSLEQHTLAGHPYFVYVPSGSGASAPLVVALHGCRQDAEAIARTTRLDDLADAEGFLVLYPQTGPALDHPDGCWRW